MRISPARRLRTGGRYRCTRFIATCFASRFGALVLDPPRAGAREQVVQIAASEATRVAYISCNPVSWSRDARVLVDAGFRLEKLRPVGQFRWSTHVELTSYFTR